MKRFWIILVLLSVAAGATISRAATMEEIRLYRAADAAFADKLYDVAEQQLAEFLKTFPDSSRANQAQLLLGRARLERGKWQAAVETLQSLLKRWPDFLPDAVRYWLAEALTRGGKFAEAQTLYREALDRFPLSQYRAATWYGLAFAQFKQGEFDNAVASLDQFLKSSLARSEANTTLALEAELLRGQLNLARGQGTQAETEFAALIQKAPESRPGCQARVWRGEALSRRQQFDEAAKDFTAVTQLFQAKPGKPIEAQLAAEAWYALGWARWQQNRFDDATDAFALALQHASADSLRRDALLKLAEASVRAGKTNDGIARLKEFVQTRPNDLLAEEIQLRIADLIYTQGDLAAALAEYARFIVQYPKSDRLARANANAGWCARKLGKLDDAAKYFDQSATLAKDSSLAANSLFKLADTQFALGQNTNALATYQRLIDQHPDLPALDRALYQLAQSQRNARQDEPAGATLALIVQRFPKSPLAPQSQFDIGLLAAARGREDEARTAFNATTEKFPNAPIAKEAALAIGESYYRQGRYAEALICFEELADEKLDTDFWQRAYYLRGLCLARKGQPATTLTLFTDFLAKNPQAKLAADFQFWIADYYLQQKDYLKAQEQFQSLVKTHPTHPLADAAQYYAGRTAYLRQDYKGAIDLFEAVLKNFPKSPWCADARFGEGDALSELGQFEDSLAVFDNLLKQFPDNPLAAEAHGRRGDCLFTLNRFDDALAGYRHALDAARDTAARNQALFKLGQCAEKQNKLDDAIQFYTRPLYETIAAPNPNEPPERFWSCKAARAAAALKEQQQQWRDAMKLYERLGELCPDLKTLADDRIRKLRVEHGILF